MKNILLASVVLVFAFSSCKKDRTCTCTATPISQTQDGVPQTVSPPTTTVTKLTKVKKGAADCRSSEQTMTYTVSYFGTQFSVVEVIKNECKLD